MKKRYLLFLLFIPIILFFFRDKKELDAEFNCIVDDIPFEYSTMDSLELRLEGCLPERPFTMEAYRKNDEHYEAYDFFRDEFQETQTVPVIVENAYSKKIGICPKLEPGKITPAAGIWKKLQGDSMYIVVYY